MPESFPKIPQSPAPVARSGAGDISERELSRERHNMQTPPTRVQPTHPKKQLFSAPVNKFTGKAPARSGNLARLRSCLDEYCLATPGRAPTIKPKAVSMEDLTPKKMKIQRSDSKQVLSPVRWACARSVAEQAAAARVARFMLVCAWRRRRHDLACLRRTLECQVSCSERLRLQVSTLKALLDGDNSKLRLAMRELERLKQLLRDKDLEKALLEREKLALERDVCAAEDQASEMSIGWRNCRNELEGARAAAAAAERALAAERAAAARASAQRDHAYHTISVTEEELSQQKRLLSAAEAAAAALRRDAADQRRRLDRAAAALRHEHEARERYEAECSSLKERVAASALESQALRESLQQLQHDAARLTDQLRRTQEQLDWWPRPLTRMLGAARWWLRHPLSLPHAARCALLPARHGC